MRDHIRERVLSEANYLIKTNETVREAANNFKVSKSTLYQDVTERLKEVNDEVYEKVQVILNYNKSTRHIRGGLATKKKYLELQQTEDTGGEDIVL